MNIDILSISNYYQIIAMIELRDSKVCYIRGDMMGCDCVRVPIILVSNSLSKNKTRMTFVSCMVSETIYQTSNTIGAAITTTSKILIVFVIIRLEIFAWINTCFLNNIGCW